MALHTIAYKSSVSVSASFQDVTPVTDNVLDIKGSNQGFFVPPGFKLIAAYAGGTTLAQVRVNTPGMLRVAYPFIRPLNRVTDGLPPDDPNLQLLLRDPIKLSDKEAMIVNAIHDGAGAEDVVVVLWIADEIEPVPAGDAFWVGYTSTDSTTADEWTSLDITLDGTLPEGVYALIGFEHHCSGCIAARAHLRGRKYRPGALGQSGTSIASTRSAEVFYGGPLGVLGTFMSYQIPAIEVLSNTGAVSSHTGYLRLVQMQSARPIRP